MKKVIRIILILVFLFIAFFSIQNFYQGYHSVDIAYNFLNLGYTQDVSTNGEIITLSQTYLNGVSLMTTSFVWFALNCLLGVLIGYLYK